MSAFRNLREVESKKRISQGDVSGLHVLYQEIDTLSPLLYGQYLMELLALVALLKEWSSPACPNPVPPAIIQLLEQLNWVNADGILFPQNIASLLNASISPTSSWLTSHGWYFTEGNTKQIDEAINTLLQCGNCSIIDRREHSPVGFGLVKRVLRELIDVYYSFAAFCCGALFKAHILFPFLLLGPDEYRSEIERLLKLRGKANRLFFDPILWRVA